MGSVYGNQPSYLVIIFLGRTLSLAYQGDQLIRLKWNFRHRVRYHFTHMFVFRLSENPLQRRSIRALTPSFSRYQMMYTLSGRNCTRRATKISCRSSLFPVIEDKDTARFDEYMMVAYSLKSCGVFGPYEKDVLECSCDKAHVPTGVQPTMPHIKIN